MSDPSAALPEIFGAPRRSATGERVKLFVAVLLAACTVGILGIALVRLGRDSAKSLTVEDVAKDVVLMKAQVQDIQQRIGQTQTAPKGPSGPASAQPDPKNAMKAWALYHEVEGIAFDRRRYPEVFDKLTQAMALDPGNVEVVNLVARVHADRKNVDEALVYFKRALDIDPQHLGSLLGITTLLMNEKRYAEAKPFVDRAVQVAPKNADVIQRKSRLEMGLKGIEQASAPAPKP